MPPIIVISLTRAVERRKAAVLQLDARKLPFEFMDAVDKDTLSSEERNRVVSSEYVLNTGRHATDGEIACFASHRKAWALCVESGSAMVIMEDDFTLSENFPEAIRVANRYSDECGFIRFHCARGGSKRKVAVDGDHAVWRYTKAPHCLAGYLLSPRAAKTLIQHSERYIGPVDVFTKMFWLHRQVMYGVLPYSVWNSDLCSDSDIGARPKAKKDLLTKLKRPLRKLSHWRQRLIANRAIPDASEVRR